ncbi:DUF2690 domain-containing protein [Bacillus sp. ISL-8]|uniref:DUF2690 domain-containing protein n=1 Tax=Bacillus mycoides TaxID=1405 RepID=A0A1W6A4E1_BACMY|nr:MULTISPECIES: DUF2690 domain-containing protein [Bacillus cereus group]MBT2580738.1 DUF2690 domain-containing protein [Bacillus sp. ISL-8]ARJ20698.1 hypothetical protein B7492_05405 [Bacillus mycoides]EJQ61365.1 hypothetical protein IEY_04547 [Bacillus mycoides]EJQ65421.1 hypothetical protein IEW_00786 [Bacillus mycoides]EJV71997.1 hypothetical protein IEU_00787 [Bacillus mycoides]
MKKKLFSTLFIFSLTFSSLFIFNLETKAAFNPDTYYTGKSPYTAVYGGSGTCADSAVQKGYKQISNLGYVELKYSTVCKTAWAKLTRYSAATFNDSGFAGIYRSDGVWFNSYASGGLGSIDSGQKVTYTPMVYDLTAGYGYTAKAAGWIRTVSGGPYSFGETGSY